MYALTSRGTTPVIILLLTTYTALAFCQLNVCQKSRITRSTSKKPEIFERPQSQKVHVNQSATFFCRVKSESPVTITWMRHEEKLIRHLPGFILLRNDSLILLHVQKSDDGIYKCIARNEVGASSSEATLTVLDPLIAPVITQVTTNQTILEDQRVTLTCKATGNPQPKISWRISPGSLSHSQPERPSPGSIRFLSATPSDSGKYSCIAVNKQGNDTRVVYLNVIGYPVFIKSPPLNLTVHENATVSLNCKVIGSPTPDVTWYYGNKQKSQDAKTVILKNNTLVISRINFENSGTYTCVANNSAGLRRSKSTLLQVLSRPRLFCCPDNNIIVRNRTAIDGNHLSLNCSAKGYPEPKYEWRFNNITISQSALFTIPRVSKNREGVYYCRIYNNLGSLLVKILLSVLIPPKVIVKPGRKIVLPGASAQFVCIATGEPVPKISWYKSEKIISHNRSLVIANVTENDEGEYLCKGQSTVGQNVAKATLVLAVHPTFTIVPPRNVTANETSFVQVRCSAKLDPDRPIINWYRLTTKGEKINISSSKQITLGRDILKISQLVRDDGGFYLCEAKNLAGVINTTFFINIQYSPRLIPLLKQVSVKAGGTTSFRCPVKANPVAQIRWIYPNRFNGYGGSHILIPIVKISDGGNYTCIASNLLGTLQSSVEVTVLTSPQIVGLKRVEMQNGWISLTCQTEGTPQPTVRWLDQATLPRASFHVLLDGNLQMEKRYINKMEFVCNASNSYGWTAKYVKTPSSPYQLNIVRTMPTSATFSWMANNSEIISDFVVERLSKADLNWITVNSSVAFSMFTDQDLQPFTWFLFRVYCKNVLGTSGPSETLNITTREGVPSHPASIVVVSHELTSITVEWKPPEQPRGLFTSICYEVSYMKRGSLFDKMKISLNNSVQYRLKITNLKSKTCYVIKVRAGRRSNYGEEYWSGYSLVQTNTLQEAPVISPEIERISSNGPRRIFISWKRPIEYVEGYELLYKKYESRDNMTVLKINSWNTTHHMITGLSASQYYDIQLRMFTSGGYGPWSLPAVVIRTDQDEFTSPGTLSSFSDSLTWKIALGVSISALIFLSLLLVYIYWTKKSKKNGSDKKERIKSRKKDGYDFDIGSRVSNESEGSIEGIYNVNMEEDIDLSLFANSHHATATDSYLYVENPILPPEQLESDDSHEAVRLATFTTRPSPLGTPGGSPSLSKRNLFEFNELSSQDVVEPPVYAKVDFSAKARGNRSADTFEQLTVEGLV